MAKEEISLTRNIQEVIIDNPRTSNKKVRWLNVTNAGKKEIEYLRKKYGFQISHLQQCSASVFAQRPAIHHYDGYIFLVLHFPIIVDNNVVVTEVDFFIGHGFLVTVHNGNLVALNDFFSLCKKDGEGLLSYRLESSSILLYELMDKLMHGCFPMLDQLSLKTRRVQEMIFQQDSKMAVSEILSTTQYHQFQYNHALAQKDHHQINGDEIIFSASQTARRLLQKINRILNYYLGNIRKPKRNYRNFE